MRSALIRATIGTAALWARGQRCADHHLTGRALGGVFRRGDLLTRDGQDREVLDRHTGPTCDGVEIVEGADRDEPRARTVLQPSLVELVTLTARQALDGEPNSRPGGELGDIGAAAGVRREVAADD